MKIKKGDQVKIISGNDKGKEARVLAVFVEQNRVVVEGVAMRKKHVRPRAQGQKGEVIESAGAISVSRVILVCPKCGKTTRIGYTVNREHKFRVCKRCGAEI